jgi:MtfA peptidase
MNELALMILMITPLIAVLLWLMIQMIYLFITGRELSLVQTIRDHKVWLYYKRNHDDIDLVLQAYIGYYKRLSSMSRDRFVYRVCKFMFVKEFVPMGIEETTFEMEVLISASAIQLTFGMDNYLLEHFTRILIYPDQYYSNLKQEYHKGEINLGGAIVLSYDDFIKDYRTDDDGYNLGLHEMAHALRFSELFDDETNDDFASYFSRWKEEAVDEMAEIKSEASGFLRSYATTNINEFFAVCTESFFEKPGQFRDELPELYDRMSLLLNQNPLHRDNDDYYLITERTGSEAYQISPLNLECKFTPFWLSRILPQIPGYVLLGFLALLPEISTFFLALAFIVLLRTINRLAPYRRILVYENCLFFKPLIYFGRHKEIYEHNNIAAVDISKLSENKLLLKYYEGKMIRTRYYLFSLRVDKTEKLIEKLKQHSIMVIE